MQVINQNQLRHRVKQILSCNLEPSYRLADLNSKDSTLCLPCKYVWYPGT